MQATSEYVDQMGDLGAAFGLSADQMAKWNYVAENSQLSTDQFGGALQHLTTQLRGADGAYDKQAGQADKLRQHLADLTLQIQEQGDKHGALHQQIAETQRKLQELEAATPPAAKAFGELGLQITDSQGHIRSLNDLLPEIADRFASLPDGPEKSALAMKLFGGAADQMLPLLNQGSAGIAELQQKAADLGITLDDKTVAANDRLIDAQQRLHTAFDEVGHKLGETLIPLVADAAQAIAPLVEKGLQTVDMLRSQLQPAFDEIGSVLGQVLQAVAPLTDALGLLFAGDPAGAARKIGEGLHLVVEAAWQAVQDLLGQAVQWGQGFIANFSGGLVDGIASFVQPALDTLGSFIQGFLEPHSPPPLLPALDQWGQGAAEIYLHGWTQADFSAFDQMAGTIRDRLQTLVDTKTLGKDALGPMLAQARSALQGAEGEFAAFGQVSEGAWAKVAAAIGPAHDRLLAYLHSEMDLQAAHAQTVAAQDHLTQVQEEYKRQLDDVTGKIRSLADAEKQALGSLPAEIGRARDALDGMRSASEAALHPLDVQLHDLGLRLQEVQRAGAVALEPLTAEAERAKAALAQLQEQSKHSLDGLRDSVQQAQAALKDLQAAGRDALAPYDAQAKALQGQLASIGQAASSALAPIDAALDAARARAQGFKDEARDIAARYDDELRPLLAQLKAVQDLELKKDHKDTLHELGLGVENLQARLANARPGTAEYIELQAELANAQEDLANKQKEFGLSDQIQQKEEEKQAAVDVANAKAAAADADVQALQRQREEIAKTFDSQRQAVESELQQVVQERAAVEEANAAKIASAQAEVAARQEALDLATRQSQAEIAAQQQVVAEADAAVKAQQAQAALAAKAIQDQIQPIKDKRDALVWAASEEQRTAQLELDSLTRRQAAIQSHYAAERTTLTDEQQAIRDRQTVEQSAAQASVQAAQDHERALQEVTGGLRAQIEEEKQAASETAKSAAAHQAATSALHSLAPALGGLRDELTQHPAIYEGARSKLDELHERLLAARDGAGQTRSGFDTFLSDLRDRWDATIGTISHGIQDFGELVQRRGVVGAIVTEISRGWTTFSGWIDQLSATILGWIGDAAAKFPGEALKYLSAQTHFIMEVLLPDLGRSAGFLAGAAVRWIKDAADAAPHKLQEFWSAIVATIEGLFKPQAAQKAGEIADNLIAGFKRLLENGPHQVKVWIDGLVNSVFAGFREGFGIKSPSTKMMEIAGYLIDGLINGIKAGVSHVGDAIGHLAGSTLDGLKSVFGIHSPSEETRQVGDYLLQGLTGGMEAGRAALDRTFTLIRGSLTLFAQSAQTDTSAALTPLPGIFATSLAGVATAWDRLFGPDAGAEGTLLNRLWGHQASSFFSVLVAYTRTKNQQWFDVVWTQVLDELASKISAYLRLKAGEIAAAGETIGQQLDEGIAHGVTAHKSIIEAVITQAIEDGIKAAERAADIHSPSGETARRIGAPMAQGVGVGIDEHAHEAQGSMQRLVGGVAGVGVPGGGVPVGAVGAGAAAGIMINATFQITVQAGPGGLAGPGADPMDNPQFWTKYARWLRIALEQEFSDAGWRTA